jgi:hypothetical protein
MRCLQGTLALLPESWHRQITIGRFGWQPNSSFTSPPLRGCHCTPSSRAGLRTVPIGEAVGITQFKSNEPPRLASHASLKREIRLSGQFAWPYDRSGDRSGTEKSEAVVLGWLGSTS